MKLIQKIPLLQTNLLLETHLIYQLINGLKVVEAEGLGNIFITRIFLYN